MSGMAFERREPEAHLRPAQREDLRVTLPAGDVAEPPDGGDGQRVGHVRDGGVVPDLAAMGARGVGAGGLERGRRGRRLDTVELVPNRCPTQAKQAISSG